MLTVLHKSNLPETIPAFFANWADGSAKDPKPLWVAISKRYARLSTGEVTSVQKYDGAVWKEHERPILKKRKAKINIVKVP